MKSLLAALAFAALFLTGCPCPGQCVQSQGYVVQQSGLGLFGCRTRTTTVIPIQTCCPPNGGEDDGNVELNTELIKVVIDRLRDQDLEDDIENEVQQNRQLIQMLVQVLATRTGSSDSTYVLPIRPTNRGSASLQRASVPLQRFSSSDPFRRR